MEIYLKDKQYTRRIRDRLSLDEIHYLKYLRLKEVRKAHWVNQRYKLLT